MTTQAGLAEDGWLLASSDQREASQASQRLAAAVTSGDWPPAHAARLAEVLIAAMETASEHSQARIALLLGTLAEKDEPGTAAVTGAVRQGLASYLSVLQNVPCGGPLYLSLLYLLAHFPADRARIMAVAGQFAADDPYGISRLDRTLRRPGPADPQLPREAGRSWPSPAFLQVSASEVDAAAEARAGFAPGVLLASWNADTAALLAYAGALAVARGA